MVLDTQSAPRNKGIKQRRDGNRGDPADWRVIDSSSVRFEKIGAQQSYSLMSQNGQADFTKLYSRFFAELKLAVKLWQRSVSNPGKSLSHYDKFVVE